MGIHLAALAGAAQPAIEQLDNAIATLPSVRVGEAEVEQLAQFRRAIACRPPGQVAACAGRSLARGANLVAC
jgi:hypothetical protein